MLVEQKLLALNKELVISIVKFSALLGVAMIVPLFHNQLITGPIVNATLFISAVLLGGQNAILIGLVPSIVALSFGLLPAVLAPMIAFIMLSNTILIISFNYFRKYNYWLGVVLASCVKFLFLFLTSSIVVDLLIKKEVATKVIMMMSWPQLYTALAGGVIAFIILKIIKKEQ